MNYNEVLAKAKQVMGPNCRVCKVCNGVACKGEVPGLGGTGNGNAFSSCVEYFDRVKIHMDVIHEHFEADTSVSLFGKLLSVPVMVAPIGGMKLNYNGYLTEAEYTSAIVTGAKDAGILGFTGDGPAPNIFPDGMAAIAENGGFGIPTLKPWENEKVLKLIETVKAAGCPAFAMDVDSAALVNLKLMGKPVYAKSQEEITMFVEAAEGMPFIVKGIMTADAAQRCADAGAYGIVISNHGGRVMQDALPPVSVIRQIRERVGGRLKLFVDGGIRSGADVFKCLALGADAVLIGRPYAVAAHGGGAEGVRLYTERLAAQLSETMLMTGCRTIGDITERNICNTNSF